MKKLLFVLLCMPVVVTAQIQKGIVRTNGNARQTTGNPLPGVVVKALGGTNEALSNRQGKVDIRVESKKEGNAYQLSVVHKKGYDLNDPMLIGRTLAYSSKTPLEIVMVSSKELNKVKTEIEERVNQQVQQKYTETMALLNDSLNKELMTVEQFRQRSDFLGKQRDLFEPLIAAMADHYAHTDFAKMDSIDIRINNCIMEGNLEQADLLMAEKGNLEERVAAIQRQKELYGQADELIKRLSKSLRQQREAYEREREDIANDLYHKYAIALAQFNPKGAGEYITLRAELDETNIGHQLDAGAFMVDYATDFAKASMYYERALAQSERQYGRESAMTSYCLNHLGGLRLQESKFAESLALRQEALHIRKKVYGNHHTSVAACYNNIANIYYSMEKFDEARVCADSAIIVYLQNDETNPSDLADAYTTKGGVEIAVGNFEGALQFYELSVAITDSIYGEENTHSATTINNIGIINDYMNQRAEAVRCYKRALELYKKIYGDKHPNVATVYSNLGTLYADMGRVDSAMICHNAALEMRLDLLGEFHEDVAVSLNNIGSLFSSMKQYDTAIDFYGKALTVIDVVLGNNTMRFATTLGNIAVVYYRQQDWFHTIDYCDAALKVYAKYPEHARKETTAMAKLEAKCYEALLQGDTLNKDGRAEAEKDYQKLKKDYRKYLEEER